MREKLRSQRVSKQGDKKKTRSTDIISTLHCFDCRKFLVYCVVKCGLL